MLTGTDDLIPVSVLLPHSRSSTPGNKPHNHPATSLHLAHHPPPLGAATVAAPNFSSPLAAKHSFPAALQSWPRKHHPNMFAPPAALPPPPPLTSSTLPGPGHPVCGTAFSGKHSYFADITHLLIIWSFAHLAINTKLESVWKGSMIGTPTVFI